MKKPKLTAVGGKGLTDGTNDVEMSAFYRKLEIDVLARTLWGEARGEGDDGLAAVANVVLNRVKITEAKGTYWWGHNIIQVCQKPYQFSCWNRSDANFKKLQAVGETNLYFATSLRIARRAIAGTLKDNTNGATHYHEKSIKPYWIRGETPVATIGNHIFYRLIDEKQ